MKGGDDEERKCEGRRGREGEKKVKVATTTCGDVRVSCVSWHTQLVAVLPV